MMFVALGYTTMYSFLAHKEVRFLYPTIPLWNMSAAIAMCAIFSRNPRATDSVLWQTARLALRVACIAGLFVGATLTYISSSASYSNYPGGDGLLDLVARIKGETPSREVAVHIDTLAASTGVSRFLQDEYNGKILYSKEEGIGIDEYRYRPFDYLLNENPEVPGYSMVWSVPGFGGIHIDKHAAIGGCASDVHIRTLANPVVALKEGCRVILCVVNAVAEGRVREVVAFPIDIVTKNALYVHEKLNE